MQNFGKQSNSVEVTVYFKYKKSISNAITQLYFVRIIIYLKKKNRILKQNSRDVEQGIKISQGGLQGMECVLVNNVNTVSIKVSKSDK